MTQSPFAPTIYDAMLYDTKAAAKYLNLSVTTLERHRSAGTGPIYRKCGPGKRAKVLYTHSALENWLNSFTFTSTSQYGR